ncbi:MULTISPECIES: hypothetical protein [Paraglaciecola]|uniref:hypothetical protein n=1 Tax=Paraglaciecola TaxID=1621534 RepID=UPI00129AA962|nr:MULTISPECIES: hypothetical protein [Paraglaciecola]
MTFITLKIRNLGAANVLIIKYDCIKLYLNKLHKEQEYEAANEVAKSNFKKLSNSLPLKLKQKEAKNSKANYQS